MDPNKFINEVYRRMSILNENNEEIYIDRSYFFKSIESKIIASQLKNIIPNDKQLKILEIGYGTGFFISACIQLGYKNIYGMDFHNARLLRLQKEEKAIKKLYNIENTIWETLNNLNEKFDFIYLSHVIEHIPKYNLLDAVDSINNSLKTNGMFFVKCPNMISYGSFSSLYCTLGHEYGFTDDNLRSLLSICGFKDIKSYQFKGYSFKNKIGNLLKVPFILIKKIQNRLFGVHGGKNYDSELIMSAIKDINFDKKSSN